MEVLNFSLVLRCYSWRRRFESPFVVTDLRFQGKSGDQAHLRMTMTAPSLVGSTETK